MAIGINVAGLAYFGNARAYANLLAPGSWRSNVVSGWGPMPDAQIDPDGAIKYLQSDKNEKGIVNIPALEGPYTSKDVRCTYEGNGWLDVGSEGALKWQGQGAGFLDFAAIWQIQNENIKSGWVEVRETNAADPLRNIDCREKNMDKNLLWSPLFIESLKGFNVIRFLDWSEANGNAGGDWNRFISPNNQYRTSWPEGVRPDDMIALANQMDADPWIPLAYNGDENYHRKYATLVRDTLKPGRRAYVELGNEVWNYMFSVTGQARDEGVAAKLSADPNQAMLYRYGQKSAWALKIWSDVFAGQMHRLVRVVNVQGGGWSADQVLSFQDTHKVVDAVAIAPYIQLKTEGLTLDQVYTGLNDATDEAIAEMVKAKVTAKQYGKRLIAYEAGQHIVTQDVAFARVIQRDPRMEGVYKKYIDAWQEQIGDLIVMYSHTGPISPYGSWGLREYAGQPASEAPKWRAVQSYLKK